VPLQKICRVPEELGNRREASPGLRGRLAELDLTRLLSRVGAVLALLATLWATLIGRTIPDLLRSNQPPLVEFRTAAQHACSRLPQAGSTTNGVSGSPHRPVTGAVAERLGRQFDDDTWLPFDAVTKQLLTLTAPSLISSDLRSLRTPSLPLISSFQTPQRISLAWTADPRRPRRRRR
jgi:hypothetical protein